MQLVALCSKFRFETDNYPGTQQSDMKDELGWSINYRVSETCTDMPEVYIDDIDIYT